MVAPRYVEAWSRVNPAVKLVSSITRNFGHQYAVSAGLALTSGRYVGIMDADLQDEPEVLLDMYQLLRSDKLDVVYAVRATRPEGRLKRFCYYMFYRLYTFLADTPVQVDSGDFCVMTRRAVTLFLAFPEKLRSCAARAWLVCQPRPLPITTRGSRRRQPQYSIWQLVKLASGRTYFLFD